MRPKKDLSICMSIGCNLKKLRAIKFPSHGQMKEMCKIVGVSPQTWNKWESGVISPSERNLKRVAEVFAVSVTELRGEAEWQSQPAPAEAGANDPAARLFSTLLEAHGALSDIAGEVKKGNLPPGEALRAVEEALDIVLKVHGTAGKAGMRKSGG